MAKKAEAPTTRAASRKAVPEATVWIVNPAGALHEVSRSHARERMSLDRRYRLATEAEKAEYQRRGGNQVFDDPIAEPWVDPLHEAVGDE